MRGFGYFFLFCFGSTLVSQTVYVLDGCLHCDRYNLGLLPGYWLHMLPVFWPLLLSVLSLEFCVQDVVLVRIAVSCAHLTFLRCNVAFTKHCYCVFILG